MELFRDELASVTLISVGHRSELEDYHDRKLTLHRHATRVEMAAARTSGTPRAPVRPAASFVASAAVTRSVEPGVALIGRAQSNPRIPASR